MTESQELITVVFIDHSYLHQINWVEKFASGKTGIKTILITDKSPSRVDGAFEVINVRDMVAPKPLSELQKTFDFSIYRALVAERAYFDYTTFDNSQCYSRVNLKEIESLIAAYVNVLDDVIKNRADLVIGHMADNAIAALAMNIAAQYGTPYAAPFLYYWWSNGFMFANRPDQTSSDVDALYHYYYANEKWDHRGV